jgi:hypothetical protein
MEKQKIDAPGTTPELRKYVDDEFGKDWVVLSLGFTKAYIQNAQHGGKIELPMELRPKIARLLDRVEAAEAAEPTAVPADEGE